MSNFDPDVFLSSTIDAKLDTRLIPVPADEYTAMLEDIRPRLTQGKDGTEYLVFDIVWSIDDVQLKTKLGRDKVTCRQSIFLDRTPDGSIDVGKGRNVQLGRLREAVGQNHAGAWAPSMLKGSAARIKVVHEADKNGEIYDKVVAVTKL